METKKNTLAGQATGSITETPINNNNIIPNNALKVKCNIDEICYKEKPKDKDAEIAIRLKNKTRIKELTINQLANAITKGYGFSSAELVGAKKVDWVSQRLFIVDIDNEEKEYPITTPEKAIEIMQEKGISHSFIYYTFSSTPEKPKFRIVAVCDETITANPKEAENMNKAFISLFNQADKQCYDLSRSYYGTNKGLFDEVKEVTFDKNILLDLIPKKLKDNNVISYPNNKKTYTDSDFDLETAKKDFDLADYIKNNHNLKEIKESGNRIVFNPCPLCGHNGDFTVYNRNTYKCFGKTNGTGGTIIDYLMAKDNLSTAEAIEKFKYDVLGIERKTNLTILSNINTSITNPDFIPVNWNLDFTLVSWKEGSGVRGGQEKHTASLREFLERYPIKEGRPEGYTFKPKPVQENMLALLKHYYIELKFNIITDNVDVFINKKQTDTLENITQFIWDNCEKHNFILPKERLISLMIAIARNNKYNPIEEYLLYCHKKWDGKDRIKDMCNTITSSIQEKELYMTKFLVQMVALAICDEDSTIAGQYLLVLQGKQGLGKTTWFKNLIPLKMQQKYFLGGRNLDPSNKDHVLESATNWLVEMGEISSTFRKADQEVLKAYITAFKDRVRPPYGKEAIDKKRRTTLCGTTNDTEYLRDETGSRRFLTIPCDEINYNHDVDLDQLWGQVYNMFLEGYTYYFTPEENDIITANNERYKVKSDIQLYIEMYFDIYPDQELDTFEAMTSKSATGEFLTSKEIAEYINNQKSDTEDRLTPIQIGKTLKKLGVKSVEERSRTVKFYVSKL